MRRGFKAAADRHASDLRTAIGCTGYESIDLTRLARHLKVAVIGVDKILGSIDPLRVLHEEQPGAFSAATLILLGRTVVAYNPLDLDGRYISPSEAKEEGRTRSNVAHEFSHLVLGHDVREVQKIAEHSFFTCNAEQETEANWLAGCLLLPRPLLVKAAGRGDTDSDVAHANNVTEQMAAFRMNTSGARMQAARGRAKHGSGR
ncbi:MAG: ImmA/IrrE family metallo-endopeptidase [Actinobacteria bacterium]|nr:ImmA/IrrE family metallo-endopeptidase [Actinomycetota bacterium]